MSCLGFENSWARMAGGLANTKMRRGYSRNSLKTTNTRNSWPSRRMNSSYAMRTSCPRTAQKRYEVFEWESRKPGPQQRDVVAQRTVSVNCLSRENLKNAD